MKCPYCKQDAELVTGRALYPHRPDLFEKKFYSCAPCDAYVGCHGSSERPLGPLANGDLRRLRRRAHNLFDVMWKNGHITRTQAYAVLSQALGIPKHECHIGMMDEKRCQAVIDYMLNPLP